MNEAMFGSHLRDQIEKEIGGKMLKISDRSTLGLPDYSHVRTGVVTYIETKLGVDWREVNGKVGVQPWAIIKKDLRQYEMCRMLSKHTLVMYVIYYHTLKRTIVLPMDDIPAIKPLSPTDPIPWVFDLKAFHTRYGINRIRQLMNEHRGEIHESLRYDY